MKNKHEVPNQDAALKAYEDPNSNAAPILYITHRQLQRPKKAQIKVVSSAFALRLSFLNTVFSVNIYQQQLTKTIHRKIHIRNSNSKHMQKMVT